MGIDDCFNKINEALSRKRKADSYVSYVFDRIKRIYYLQIQKCEYSLNEADFNELNRKLTIYAFELENDTYIKRLAEVLDNKITKIAENIENCKFWRNACVDKITDEASNVKYRIEYNDIKEDLSYEEAVDLLNKLTRIARFHKQSGEDFKDYSFMVFFIGNLLIELKDKNVNVEDSIV